MGPPAKSHSNSNSYAIMARHMENLWVRSCLHIHILVNTYIYRCFENIAFSNQLNFNLHNFLYVKVMCTKFDYFPLNWAEDITSGLKVDKAGYPRSFFFRQKDSRQWTVDSGRWTGHRTREYANTQMGVSWSGQTLLQNLFVFQLVRGGRGCLGQRAGRPTDPQIHPPTHTLWPQSNPKLQNV